MTETLACGYSSQSAQQQLSNEYQHDRLYMFFKNRCVFFLRTKVASALEGLNSKLDNHMTLNKCLFRELIAII